LCARTGKRATNLLRLLAATTSRSSIGMQKPISPKSPVRSIHGGKASSENPIRIELFESSSKSRFGSVKPQNACPASPLETWSSQSARRSTSKVVRQGSRKLHDLPSRSTSPRIISQLESHSSLAISGNWYRSTSIRSDPVGPAKFADASPLIITT
jgi:hypothetical protein